MSRRRGQHSEAFQRVFTRVGCCSTHARGRPGGGAQEAVRSSALTIPQKMVLGRIKVQWRSPEPLREPQTRWRGQGPRRRHAHVVYAWRSPVPEVASPDWCPLGGVSGTGPCRLPFLPRRGTGALPPPSFGAWQPPPLPGDSEERSRCYSSKKASVYKNFFLNNRNSLQQLQHQ